MASEYEDEHSKNQILDAVPQHRRLRHQQRQDRGRRPGGRAGLLRQGRQGPRRSREAALLAGLPQAPSRLQPVHQPQGRAARRNEVLEAMRDQGYISPATVHEGGQARARPAARPPATRQRSQQYFFDFVQQRADRQVRRRRRCARAGSRSTRRSTRSSGRRPSRRSPPHPRHRGRARRSSRPTPTRARSWRWRPRSPTTTSQFNLAAQATPPAGLVVQALRADRPRSTRASTRTRPTTRRRDSITLTRPAASPGPSAGERRRVDEPARRDRALRQHRLRAARRSTSGPRTSTTWRTSSASRRPLYGISGRGARRTSDRRHRRSRWSNAYATLANGGVHHDPTAIAQGRLPRRRRRRARRSADGNRVISDGVAYDGGTT